MQPQRWRRRAQHSILLAALLSTACTRKDSGRPLAGEWRIDLVVSGYSPGGGAQSTDGAIVFSRMLPRPRLGEESPDVMEVGRGYIDFERLFTPRSLRQPSYYAQGDGADISEEILVTRRRQHAVTFLLAPQIMGTTTWFEGRVRNGRVEGTWAMLGHGDTIRHGSFTMSRVHPTAFTDSAHARSKRAVAPPTVRVPGGASRHTAARAPHAGPGRAPSVADVHRSLYLQSRAMGS